MNRANFTIGTSRYDGSEPSHSRGVLVCVERGLRVDSHRAHDPGGGRRAPTRTCACSSPSGASRSSGTCRSKTTCRRRPSARSRQRAGEVETVERMLEVQTIISRTYAVSHLGRHAREGFDLCSTTHCQLFDPRRLQTSRWAGGVARGRRAHGRRHPHVRPPGQPGAVPRRLRRPYQHGLAPSGAATDRPYLVAQPDDGAAETRTPCGNTRSRSTADRGARRRPADRSAARSTPSTSWPRRRRPRGANRAPGQCEGRWTHASRHGHPRRRVATGADARVRPARRSAARDSTSAGPARCSCSPAAAMATASASARPAPSPACAPARQPPTSSVTTIRARF